MARVKINRAGLAQILGPAAAPHISRIADRVAASIVASVGEIDGQMVEPARYDNEPRGQRVRSAIVLTHPSNQGRQAANEAAPVALRVAGE